MGGKIIFWNCALGIKSKFDFLKDLATTQRPDLMFISEAEVNDCDLSLINIKGYEISVSESINGEFGVARMACYIKMGIKAKKIRVDNDWMLWQWTLATTGSLAFTKGLRDQDHSQGENFLIYF